MSISGMSMRSVVIEFALPTNSVAILRADAPGEWVNSDSTRLPPKARDRPAGLPVASRIICSPINRTASGGNTAESWTSCSCTAFTSAISP